MNTEDLENDSSDFENSIPITSEVEPIKVCEDFRQENVSFKLFQEFVTYNNLKEFIFRYTASTDFHLKIQSSSLLRDKLLKKKKTSMFNRESSRGIEIL